MYHIEVEAHSFFCSIVCSEIPLPRNVIIKFVAPNCPQMAHSSITKLYLSSPQFIMLRRLERVFRCCSVCEMMEDYKEGYLMVWTNYMSPCSSIVGLCFKGTRDVISVTMAMHKVHKSVL